MTSARVVKIQKREREKKRRRRRRRPTIMRSGTKKVEEIRQVRTNPNNENKEITTIRKSKIRNENIESATKQSSDFAKRQSTFSSFSFDKRVFFAFKGRAAMTSTMTRARRPRSPLEELSQTNRQVRLRAAPSEPVKEREEDGNILFFFCFCFQ